MLVPIDDTNATVYEIIVQEYEDEFSPITGKEKGENGKYAVDVDYHSPNAGFYYKDGDEIVGFCIKSTNRSRHDVAEFYIIPKFRNCQFGYKMAAALFNKFPGPWQVRQIEGADAAKEFWRRVIEKYSEGNFQEIEFHDPYWGDVTCQEFVVKS